MSLASYSLAIGSLILLSWLVVWADMVRTGPRAWGKRRLSRDEVRFSFLTIAVFALVFLLYCLLWSGWGASGAPQGAAGFSIAAAGLMLLIAGEALMLAARRALRHLPLREVLFCVQPQETYVHQGPYRYVKHPMYAGLLLALVGSSLAFCNWLGVAATILVIAPLLAARASIESAGR